MIFNGEIIEFPRTEEIENPYLRLAIDTFPLCIKFKLLVHDEITNTQYSFDRLNDLAYEYSIRSMNSVNDPYVLSNMESLRKYPFLHQAISLKQ